MPTTTRGASIFIVIFRATYWPGPQVRARADVRSVEHVNTEIRLTKAISGEMTRQGLGTRLGLKNDEHFRKAYLLHALQAGLNEMTIPDKPRSRNQRYRLTPEGREFLRQTQESQYVTKIEIRQDRSGMARQVQRHRSRQLEL